MAYHEGETGAKTPYDCMHKLQNEYTIKDTTLGGSYFKMPGSKALSHVKLACKWEKGFMTRPYMSK